MRFLYVVKTLSLGSLDFGLWVLSDPAPNTQDQRPKTQGLLYSLCRHRLILN